MSTIEEIQQAAETLANLIYESNDELQPTFDEIEDGDGHYRLLQIFTGDDDNPIGHIRFPIWK